MDGSNAVLVMQCARLQLQERKRPVKKAGTAKKPQRYCQKRLVNPDHDEDPRWNNIVQRFRCNIDENDEDEPEEIKCGQPINGHEDLYLSVQTLMFKGNEYHNKRPRTSFKYKSPSKAHRMFIKEVVSDEIDDGRSSQLTFYYYDDYAKYLHNDTRPSTAKSSELFEGDSNKKNKSTQVEVGKNNKKLNKNKHSSSFSNILLDRSQPENPEIAEETSSQNLIDEDGKTAFSYHKSGKRKSLLISRAPSPETVQVIRVEVICNHAMRVNSTTDHEDDNKQNKTSTESFDNKLELINIKNNIHRDKYLLTNTIKSLDERVSAGDKVTLLCKTFKLCDRSKLLNKNSKIK